MSELPAYNVPISIRDISWLERVQLWFVREQVVCDITLSAREQIRVYYKMLRGVMYVTRMSVERV